MSPTLSGWVMNDFDLAVFPEKAAAFTPWNRNNRYLCLWVKGNVPRREEKVFVVIVNISESVEKLSKHLSFPAGSRSRENLFINFLWTSHLRHVCFETLKNSSLLNVIEQRHRGVKVISYKKERQQTTRVMAWKATSLHSFTSVYVKQQFMTDNLLCQ